MKVYIKYLSSIFFKSLAFVFIVMLCLVVLLNILTELEFFKDIKIGISYTLFLSLLNSPSLIFEMFPFILLISTQLFFIKIYDHKEIEIFKYSGLKNSKILIILSILSFCTGLLISTLFYNFSSNLKNLYLEIKSNYTIDGKYLAVITKNGLWIKDKIKGNTLITNSSYIEGNYLIENFITEFDNKFKVIRNIQSEKIDITENTWVIQNAKIYKNNNYNDTEKLKLETNFNSERIQTLYSNLSALSLGELYELRNNYKKQNYSIVDIDLHLIKIFVYPLFLLLITLFSSSIMLTTKDIKSVTVKILIGLFFSVIIYYLNNFSYVLGSTERISLLLSTISPLLILVTINCLMLYRANEK
ncbi:LptF/LptG family permease [Candidatus Pelagibacter sp.]|uniref:LptF/LptG family permease n=1 Tax=Candidatus Pelagibacter sp. TaxID=2024849 RepID=UPI003F84C731